VQSTRWPIWQRQSGQRTWRYFQALFQFQAAGCTLRPFLTARRPNLDLADAGCHAEISNRSIVGLAGTMRHDSGIAMCPGELYA